MKTGKSGRNEKSWKCFSADYLKKEEEEAILFNGSGKKQDK